MTDRKAGCGLVRKKKKKKNFVWFGLVFLFFFFAAMSFVKKKDGAFKKHRVPLSFLFFLIVVTHLRSHPSCVNVRERWKQSAH